MQWRQVYIVTVFALVLQFAAASGFTARHERGLDYAQNSATVQAEIMRLGVQMNIAVSTGPQGSAVATITSLAAGSFRAGSEIGAGNYRAGVRQAALAFSEALVSVWGQGVLEYPVSIARIAAAWTTAYIYGFGWGR